MQHEKSEYIQEPICKVNGERVVKRYKKIKTVGQGSYSKCWLVQTQGSNSIYVVKILPKSKLELLVKEKLVYEIKIHQQLSHPNVVHLDHWFQDQVNQYIFLEYCSEGNLQKRLNSRSKMNQKEIKSYVRQIIDALAYIHSKNILHRDLKLCNFYLDSNDQIKLGDFGFACQLAYPNQLKRQTCGTPNYIAPQAVSGFGYSFSSDVWGIGVILFRLKFKICPFQGKSVRDTLQRVKTCQYSFPKGQKISPELKDLIQKIFVINYDDRLTLDQIIAHRFFDTNNNIQSKPSQSQTKSFSMLRNIFSKDKKDDKKQKQQAKRSNSCQTFKQIKQIFKNKSKGTLTTSLGTEMKTQDNLGISALTVTHSNRERSSIGGTSMRSVIPQNNFGNHLLNSKRLQGNTRVNNFIGNVKQQLKLQSKILPPPNQKSTTGNISQQLILIAKKHYLPFEIQTEKDVIIIHYKDSIKQILHGGNSYIIHRSCQNIYEMNGNIFYNPPKILKYILENKVSILQSQPEQEEYGINNVQKILLFVSHKSIILKDGIILRFGNTNAGIFVAKMTCQQLFYIGSTTRDGDHLKEDGKISLMYLKQGKSYKCAEGVVLSRIYQGWIANAFKHYKE